LGHNKIRKLHAVILKNNADGQIGQQQLIIQHKILQ